MTIPILVVMESMMSRNTSNCLEPAFETLGSDYTVTTTIVARSRLSSKAGTRSWATMGIYYPIFLNTLSNPRVESTLFRKPSR